MNLTSTFLQLPYTISFNLMKILWISLFLYLKNCNLLHKKLEKNPSLAWTSLYGFLEHSQLNSFYLSILKKKNKKGLNQQGIS